MQIRSLLSEWSCWKTDKKANEDEQKYYLRDVRNKSNRKDCVEMGNDCI